MRAEILVGGLSTRLSEETDTKPKPMVEIDWKTVLWHILKIYSHHGINDFIICLGYKGNKIKEYFINYAQYNSDLTIEMNEQIIMEINNKKIMITGGAGFIGSSLINFFINKQAQTIIGEIDCFGQTKNGLSMLLIKIQKLTF